MLKTLKYSRILYVTPGYKHASASWPGYNHQYLQTDFVEELNITETITAKVPKSLKYYKSHKE